MGKNNNFDYLHDVENEENWVFLNDRSKGWTFMLYVKDPDSGHYSIFLRLLKFCYTNNVRFAYVLHDKDVLNNDEHTLAKPHLHFYLYCQFSESHSGIYKRSLYKQLDLDLSFRFCQSIVGEKAFIRYLLHYDQPDKFPYDISDLYYIDFSDDIINGYFSTPRARFKGQNAKVLSGEDSLTMCLDLIDTLFYQGYRLDYRVVTRKLLENGLYRGFVGHQGIIFKYVDTLRGRI